MSRTHILGYEARQQNETALGGIEDACIAKDVSVHQPRRDTQIFGATPVHLPHHPLRNFPVDLIEECLSSMHDSGRWDIINLDRSRSRRVAERLVE